MNPAGEFKQLFQTRQWLAGVAIRTCNSDNVDIGFPLPMYAAATIAFCYVTSFAVYTFLPCALSSL
jgi:hypothetical protein